MTGTEAVAMIYAVGGSTFLLALFAGFLRTFARVLYYARHKAARPRLLTRDVLVIGGLVVSFGAIVLIRFLPLDVRQAVTTGNVLWALVTTVPAAASMLVYAFYEWAVIERPR